MSLANDRNEAVERFIHEYVGSMAGVVVGLSGGVDSSLVAALAVRALGKERVHGLIMPHRDSDPQSQEHGLLIAKWLGIDHYVINITASVDSELLILPFVPKELVIMNTKARVRADLLRAYANQYNMLVIGTGNLSELMVGYLTKGGDGDVDFEPIGGCYKTEVWEMCRQIDGFPPIIIDKKPTADLKPGQTDEGELGMDYHQLDAILLAMSGGNDLTIFDSNLVARVKKLVANSAHKRDVPPRGPRID